MKAMGSLTIRNLDDGLLQGLAARARLSGSSVEDVAADILASAVQPAPGMDRAELLARMDAFRAQTAGSQQTPSEVLLRQMRDER
jgi:plasmid stability protein